MKVYSTYSVKIKHYNKIFAETVAVYRSAVDYLINVVADEWDVIKGIEGSQARMRCVEILCHGTESNLPKYDFDKKFYKFPSYLRRGAILDRTITGTMFLKQAENVKQLYQQISQELEKYLHTL